MSQFRVDANAPHLGGYIIGGDDATMYPELWDWLVEIQGVRSVLDVGCGEGHALDYFRQAIGGPAAVLGVDGIEQGRSDVVTHDYATGPWEPTDEDGTPLSITGQLYDMVWCCEFVEHVKEWYVPNFLATFRNAERVLMTHAEPGQRGHHHVNCRTADYWVGAMAAIGYQLDLPLTTGARALAGLNRSPWNHFARSGMAFVRL